MLKTYYCPKCQHLRQFFLERSDKEPRVCGHLDPADGYAGVAPNVPWHICQGVLLPVVNVFSIVSEAPHASI